MEAVAIVTWPALAGKGSLGVMTIGVLVAPARLALIYVYRQEQKSLSEDTEDTSHLLYQLKYFLQVQYVVSFYS